MIDLDEVPGDHFRKAVLGKHELPKPIVVVAPSHRAAQNFIETDLGRSSKDPSIIVITNDRDLCKRLDGHPLSPWTQLEVIDSGEPLRVSVEKVKEHVERSQRMSK